MSKQEVYTEIHNHDPDNLVKEKRDMIKSSTLVGGGSAADVNEESPNRSSFQVSKVAQRAGAMSSNSFVTLMISGLAKSHSSFSSPLSAPPKFFVVLLVCSCAWSIATQNKRFETETTNLHSENLS